MTLLTLQYDCALCSGVKVNTWVGGQSGENGNGMLVEATGSRHLSTWLSEVIILIGHTNLDKTGLKPYTTSNGRQPVV